MPFTMCAFFIGALSVTGLPPTGGFISKWMMLIGALDADLILIMVVYLVSSFLNACYFFPIVYRAFFKSPEGEPTVKEAPLFCVIPPVVTALSSIVLFFFYTPFTNLILGAFNG